MSFKLNFYKVLAIVILILDFVFPWTLQASPRGYRPRKSGEPIVCAIAVVASTLWTALELYLSGQGRLLKGRAAHHLACMVLWCIVIGFTFPSSRYHRRDVAAGAIGCVQLVLTFTIALMAARSEYFSKTARIRLCPDEEHLPGSLSIKSDAPVSNMFSTNEAPPGPASNENQTNELPRDSMQTQVGTENEEDDYTKISSKPLL